MFFGFSSKNWLILWKSRVFPSQMADDSNDDVQAVETSEDRPEEEISEDKPIMSLFQRLIGSDNKQNTVLTNAQIKDILKKEFDIETSEMHELEEDIYLNVMKKFLKDWPQWDEFDRTIVNLKLKGDQAGLKTILRIKYKSLRKYLKLMLDIAEPLARESVKGIELTEANSINKQKPNNLDDIVLEVHCNRAQLNKLFYRHPHPDQNGTVFNIEDAGPSRITVTKPTIEGIINSFGICVQLSIHSITITRFTCHELSHVLVNRKLKIPRESRNELKESIQMQVLTKPSIYAKKNILEKVTEAYKTFVKKGYTDAVTVLKVLMLDLAEGPETFRVPARYRKYMSKYAYKRRLNADLPEGIESDEKYDLQLEETISPRYQYTVHKFGTSKEKMYTLQIECSQCGTKYKGYNMMSELEQHYLGFHSQEQDVTCSNCNETFSVDYLTDKRWQHSCTK